MDLIDGYQGRRARFASRLPLAFIFRAFGALNSGRLKHVAQRELHQASRLGLAKRCLRVRQVSESRRRLPTEDERIRRQTRAVEPGQSLRVRDVENFPTER